jgi:CPA1 family monovalent cation:H+ antiporter
LSHELLAAQRSAIVRLRNEGAISSEVMRRVERDLDLEESRLEI